MQGLLINIKRNIIFLFLLILLLFLLWLRIFVVPKSQQEANNAIPVQTLPSITPPVQIINESVLQIAPAPNIASGQITYTYNGEDINLSRSLSIFTYETPVTLTLENAATLASFFNMPSDPFLQGTDVNNYPYYTFKNNDETFITGGSFPSLNYIKGNPQQTSQIPVQFDQVSLLQSAINELNRVGITNIQSNNPTVAYYKVTTYAPSLNENILEETANQEEASYIKFSFPLTIGNFPIVSQEYKDQTSYVILDSDGQLHELFSFIIPPTSSTVTATTTFSDLINNINQSAIVLNATSSLDRNNEASETYTISSVNLVNPQIYYFLPSSFTYNLDPYLLFNGKSFDAALNQEVDILVLVPVN